MDVTLTPVLVLNASYEPIAIFTARRAIKLLTKGAARTEKHRERFVHHSIRLPSVIRLVEYRRVPMRKQMLSRKNILLRDRHTCQYCSQTFPPAKLTLDHVLPKSRGGGASWENLVAACYPCNHKKGNQTTTEAGMTLLRPPRPLTIHTHRSILRSAGSSDKDWQQYLFY